MRSGVEAAVTQVGAVIRNNVLDGNHASGISLYRIDGGGDGMDPGDGDPGDGDQPDDGTQPPAGGTDGDSFIGPPAPESEAGCSVGRPSDAGWLVLVLGALLARRRRRSAIR